jgi:hypothetical protein
MNVARQPTIEGSASGWLRERIEHFCESLDGDPWGSEPPGRIVLSSDYAVTLRTHLPSPEFAAWQQRHHARGGQALGVGMGFRARDGVATVVVAALPEATLRNELLSLICHEICETTMVNEDGPFLDLHDSMSRVLWSEHVVERRRSARFHRFGWTRGALDDGHLCELLADYETEFPTLRAQARCENAVPGRLYGHWQILAREFVCSLGRARGGDSNEEAEVQAFIAQQHPTRRKAWLAIERLVDDLYDHPSLSGSDLDDRARQSGWLPLFMLLRKEWNDA